MLIRAKRFCKSFYKSADYGGGKNKQENRVIITFRDKITKKIFGGEKVKHIDNLLFKKTRRRLELLNAAKKIEDLYFPPSNKFHSLEGFEPPRYAIWVNNQWRISFEWHKDNNVYDVFFEDYH